MFVAEAQLVAQLVHQHVVQLHHLGLDGDRLFMVFELVRGVTLEALVARHRQRGEPLPVELAVYVASRVARALQYAHGRQPVGIAHLDVNSRNVLVDREGVVKLTDFGIARALERAGRAGEEGRVGDGSVDRRDDVFALGALLLELLTGENRLPGRRWSRGVARFEEPELPGCPASLRSLLDRMLQRGEPMSDAGELARQLELEIYRSGYGPTFSTLGGHLAELFPAL